MELGTKIRVVCIGDGITEGFGLGNDPSVYYPSLLQEFLGDEYAVFNEGVRHSCVTMMEADGGTCGLPYVLQPEYDEALSLTGDIYIIMLGTNDAQDGMHDTEDIRDPYHNLISYEPLFETFYQYLIDGVRSANPNALIYLVTPIPIRNCIWRKHRESYLLQLLPHIRTLAETNGTGLVDLHEEFLRLGEEQLDAIYQEDGLHPNTEGAFLIASILAYVIGNRAYT